MALAIKFKKQRCKTRWKLIGKYYKKITSSFCATQITLRYNLVTIKPPDDADAIYFRDFAEIN